MDKTSKLIPLDPKGNVQGSIWINSDAQGRKYMILKVGKGYTDKLGRWHNPSVVFDTRELYWMRSMLEHMVDVVERISARQQITIMKGEVNFMNIELTEDGSGPYQRHEPCAICATKVNYHGPHMNPVLCKAHEHLRAKFKEEEVEA